MKSININQEGFTLIELLIVIAIIAILASTVFVSLDPLTRFRDARDSARWSGVSTLINAIKIDQIDNGGSYNPEITALTKGTVYMIGTDTTGCDDAYDAGKCDAIVLGDTDCVNLTKLVDEGYVGSIPISPNGVGTWTAGKVGYTLMASSSGLIYIQACESENTTNILLSR